MRNKSLNLKICEETGLDEGGAYWYKKFIESSSLIGGIVMQGEVQHEIQKLISISEKTDFNSVSSKRVKNAYNFILNEFKDKQLVGEYVAGNGVTYPKIIGYNYYNDEEFYFKIRKRGEFGWNGRISREHIYPSKIIREMFYGYEFENKELEQMVLN